MSGTVRLPPDSTGKYVDTSELTVGGNTVERQNICIADNATAANIADVVAKGTQGAFGLATQDLKDSGRTSITFVVDDIANVTAETLATMTVWKGTVSSSTSSYAITSGKTLRITSMTAMVRATAAAVGTVRSRLRWSTTTLATNSAVAANLMASVSATSGLGNATAISPADGIEISATANVGISNLGSATTSNISITVTGFEY